MRNKNKYDTFETDRPFAKKYWYRGDPDPPWPIGPIGPRTVLFPWLGPEVIGGIREGGFGEPAADAPVPVSSTRNSKAKLKGAGAVSLEDASLK